MVKGSISIVTPSFNQVQFIEQTIDSVLSQGYPNLEYVIIDGGSTDGTVDIIKKYANHLTYWVSEPDQGQSDAINKGLSHVSGDIFNWINSDDYYEPGVFSAVSSAFESALSIDIVCGKERVFNELGTVRYKDGSTVLNKIEDTILRAHIDQPPTFWKLEVVKGLGGVRNSLRYLMDVDLWIRYLLGNGQDSIVKIDELLTNFREHGQSKTTTSKDGFDLERKAIDNALKEYAGLPTYLQHQEMTSREESNLSFVKQDKSDRKVDGIQKRLLGRICENSYGQFILDGNYKKARECFFLYLQHGEVQWTWGRLKVLVLLILSPKSWRSA